MAKKQIAIQVDRDLLERVQNIVFWTPGVTITSLVGDGIEREVKSREKKNGGRFKSKASNINRGRPQKE